MKKFLFALFLLAVILNTIVLEILNFLEVKMILKNLYYFISTLLIYSGAIFASVVFAKISDKTETSEKRNEK